MVCFGGDWPVPPKPALIYLLIGLALFLNLGLSVPHLRRRVAGAAAAAALAVTLWGTLEAIRGGLGPLERAVLGESSDAAMQLALQPRFLFLAEAGVFSAISLGLVWRPHGWLAGSAGIAGAALAVVYFVFTVGMLYGIQAFRFGLLWRESFLASTAALALALAMVASAGTHRHPLRTFWGATNRAQLLRVFVPTTVALLLLAELLSNLLGQFLPLDDAAMRFVHILLPAAIVFTASVWLAQRVGRKLDTTEASLVSARDELEQRVRDRTAELLRANKELQDEICSRVLAEAAQKESLANFSALGDLVPALVFVHREGRCVYVNQSAADTVGFSRQELIGRELTDLVHPDFRDLVVDRTLRRPAGEAVPARYEVSLVTRHGEIRWVDASAQCIQLRNEPAVLICALDVTERKLAEKKLAASEERFRQVVENIREVFWMSDPAKQEHIYISKAYETIWGREREGAFSLPSQWLESVHPGDRERVRTALAALRTSGCYEEIYRIVRPDGMIRWIQDRAFPIFNEHGEIHRVAGIAEDITAWKATEESLRSSEERFRSLFEAAPIGIALLSADGHYLRINRAYCEMLGYTEVELLRLGTKRVTHPEDVAEGQQLYQQLVNGHQDHYAREKRLITKDGQVIFALSATSAVRDGEGKLRYIVSMLLDSTDRKRLQHEVLEISAMERRRIGHDLHDGLGQYLSGIAFKAKCLEEALHTEAPGSEPAASELVRLLNSAVSQARTLARGLDPVEAEVGGLVPALHKLAAESSRLFSLDCVFESNVPEVAVETGVALHLFRIAQEAITNAARHGDAGRIEVRLTQADDELRLEVEDDGGGFAPDLRPPEAGLGLRAMRYRADTIGASFNLRSRPDEGTTIRCVLPLGGVPIQPDTFEKEATL
jgi:PAS domain S-box-containing protein